MISNKDFKLTPKELECLDKKLRKFNAAFVKVGEVCDGIEITFSFVPGLDRQIYLSYAGSLKSYIIT